MSACLPYGSLACIDFMNFDGEDVHSRSIQLIDLIETYRQIVTRSSFKYSVLNHILSEYSQNDNLLSTTNKAQPSVTPPEPLLPPSTCPERLKNALWRRWWKQSHNRDNCVEPSCKIGRRRSKLANTLMRLPRESPMDPCYKPLLSPLFINTWDRKRQRLFSSSPSCPTLPESSSTRFVRSSSVDPTPSDKRLKPKSILKKQSAVYPVQDLIQFAKSLKERGLSNSQRFPFLLAAWEADHPAPHRANRNQLLHGQYLAQGTRSHRSTSPVWFSQSVPNSNSSSPSLTASPSFSSDAESEEDASLFQEESAKYTALPNIFNSSNCNLDPGHFKREHPSLVSFHWKVEQCVIVDPADQSRITHNDNDFESIYNSFYSSVSLQSTEYSTLPVTTPSLSIKPLPATVLRPDDSVSQELPVQGPHIVKVKPITRPYPLPSPPAAVYSGASAGHREFGYFDLQSLYTAEYEKEDTSEDEDDAPIYPLPESIQNLLSKEKLIYETIDRAREAVTQIANRGMEIYQNATDIVSIAKHAAANLLFF